jgi:hypothetical protein
LRSCQILCEPGMEIQTNGYTDGYIDARPF